MNKDLELRAQKLSEEAVLKNGTQFQIDRCIEEMAELTQALLKDRRYVRDCVRNGYPVGENHEHRVLEELGDVLFTLHHVMNSYLIDEIDIEQAIMWSMDRYEKEECHDNKNGEHSK